MPSARALYPETAAQALDLAIDFGSTVVLDLDGTLVPTGGSLECPPDELKVSLKALRDASVSAVIVTNRRRAPQSLQGVPVISGANKPWTSRRRLGNVGRFTCVLGDQFATDGILAVRLGVPLIRMPSLGDRRPFRARLLDRILIRMFRPMDGQR
jgi:predicted HAD superfamily phosphohydrolase YqeG